MEIERKFTILGPNRLPCSLRLLAKHVIMQGYLSVSPVVRVRREDTRYYLTCKGSGMLSHEEYNLPLTEEACERLLRKADGNVISKTRYLLPLASPRFAEGYSPAADPEVPEAFSGLTAEIDVFDAPFQGLVIAEVEFPSLPMAESYLPEDWFAEEVTQDRRFHNSFLSAAANPAELLAELRRTGAGAGAGAPDW
ncbi:CYTH domain-containing protein [Lachnoclostridium sp. Marseille-P6806]|uniref:CYTH domain-containing protein n=1 Tax=Lachnoclostridium sp. Marseille-P6806 TaxID=2364793 RepID=UPI001F5E56DF|nr:CYTH domain-containing protein [Lachnoclostridium sp. Marseille-P6806]